MSKTTTALIGAAQAAEILHVSRRQVSRYAERGRLRVAAELPGKTGSRMFDPTDVERLRAELATAKAAG